MRRSTLEQHIASHDRNNSSWEDVQVKSFLVCLLVCLDLLTSKRLRQV